MMEPDDEAERLKNYLCRAGLNCVAVEPFAGGWGHGLGAMVHFQDINRKHAIRLKLPMGDPEMKAVELAFKGWHRGATA